MPGTSAILAGLLSLLAVATFHSAHSAANVTLTPLATSGSGGAPCPAGFTAHGAEAGSCICDPELERRGIECDTRNYSLLVPNGLWVGPVSDTATAGLAVHDCVLQYCEIGRRYVDVWKEPINYDVQCGAGYNRIGILCGACRNGYSVVFGSARCRKCSNSSVATLVAYLAIGVILVFAISYLEINITGGYLNGVLFYSNIVSIYGPFLTPTSYDGRRFYLANWLTLNLGIEACFYDGMGELERIWWQLSFPLYLFALMLLVTLLARCCKFIRHAGHRIIQAFATLSILCYVSLLESGVQLLAGVTLETSTGNHTSTKRWLIDTDYVYFEGLHGALAITMPLLLIFYFIPLSSFLLFPKLLYRCRLRIFAKRKPIYDAFWDPFKSKYRFWLAVRLFFRWLPFMFAYFAPAPLNIFLTAILLVPLFFFQLLLRPFKGRWRNVVDSYFIANLIVMFMGGLYFRAEFEDGLHDQALSHATDFSTVLVTFGYLGFVGVFGYHIYIRFPRLRKCCCGCFKRNDKTLQAPPQPVASPLGQDDLDRVSIDFEIISHPSGNSNDPLVVTNANGCQVRRIDYTVLREPLLESQGSLEVSTSQNQA